MADEKSKPALTLTDGSLRATIWKQEGTNGIFYTTDFSKTYRDDNDNFQSSRSFTGTELLKLSELSKQAYQHCRELQTQARQNGKTTPSLEMKAEQER